MDNNPIYYVQKDGVYGHGVFFITTELWQAKLKAEEMANNDVDDYHEWNVMRYIPSELDKELWRGECVDTYILKSEKVLTYKKKER